MADLSVEVAVIARPGARLDACLGALAGAGVADPRVVRVRDARGGIADARNRALVACDADVLAYVDDDVAVGPAWLDGVHHAFGTDPLRAVAGGPLTPRVVAAAPWLGTDVLHTLPLLRLDGEARDLPPSQTTFPGGNVAFRAAALRGAGGFWPARGHPLARDWFGEEHHAQHELAAAGWTARYEPAMAAERVVDAGLRRRDVLHARLRYGSRFVLVGGRRPAPVAARQVAAGLVGAPLARLRGDRALAMARLVRAAEAAGVLLGPLVAHADLQPVTSRTPFVASVPPPAPHPLRRRASAVSARGRRARPTDGPRALVLVYHRVSETAHDPLGLNVAPARFAEQLDVLGERLTSLDAVVAGEHADGAVAVTFDDGYVDNLTHAAPVLDGRPATLFVTTGWTVRQQPFWWDVVSTSEPVALADRAWPPGSPTARRHAHALLQPLAPETITRLTADLDGVPDGRPMTVDELRAAAGAFTLGAHTRTHRSLAWADPQVQHDELVGSADDLARWTGRQPRTCSYPFGVPGADVDRTTCRVAREAGFTAGLLNHPGLVTRSTDRFALPRHVAPDVDGRTFAAWLAARLDPGR